jgi:hypothetical protein
LNEPEVLNYIGSAPQFIWAGDFGGDDAFAYAVNDGNTFMQIDTTSGAQTPLGQIFPFGNETWTGMAFDPTSGLMYATSTDIFASSLYVIDVTVPSATRVGNIGFPGIIALAVDDTGAMFAHDIVTDELVSIDKTTGTGTAIGSLGFDANFGQGMAFDQDSGQLYLAASTTSPSKPNCVSPTARRVRRHWSVSWAKTSPAARCSWGGSRYRGWVVHAG